MKTRLLLGLLGLSLLFNMFVLVGFIQARPRHEPGMPETMPDPEAAMVERVTRDLSLDETQAKAFADLHAKHRDQSAVFDDSLSLLRRDIAAELAKESPDVEKLRTLAGQEADMLRQRRLAGAELYRSFMALLSPQQRKMLVGRGGPGSGGPGPGGGSGGPGRPQGQREPGGRRPQGPPPQIMRKFDTNHNGILDPDEAEAAHKDLDSKRREFAPPEFDGPGAMSRPDDLPVGEGPRRRDADQGGERRWERRGEREGDRDGQPGGRIFAPTEVIDEFGPVIMIPLWRWFDADGDGELSDAEQTAMRDFTASHQAPERPGMSRPQPPREP